MTTSPLPEYGAADQSSLLRILSESGARSILTAPVADSGLAEHQPFPFMALVGQYEMRLALLLAVVNPQIGGVLLIGPRGTGKTTAVRSLSGILPDVEVSDGDDGALTADMQHPDAPVLFPESFERYQSGNPISHYEPVRLFELPLNARLDDVVGGVSERAAAQGRLRLERGILSRADGHLLYIDEINLLANDVADAILDAAAQGAYTVRRGAMSGTYRARFVLIGSMNPEEGRLRPQMLDRFGLRVNVRGLMSEEERREVYMRVQTYRRSPPSFVHAWEHVTAAARDEVMLARELLSETTLDERAVALGITLVQALDIDSHRAEYAMFEAARAHAAADGRTLASVNDLLQVAPLALRQRRSQYMVSYFEEQSAEDSRIRELGAVLHANLEARR
jgi:magnesium chelatase subunit I